MKHIGNYHKVLLALLLLANYGHSEEGEKDSSPAAADFTQAQVANAVERLSGLFDSGMDADGDGRLTQPELTAWLAKVDAEQADKDADDAWRAYNLTEEGSLAWDDFAERRAASAIGRTDDTEKQQEHLRAQVRRAIAEASAETGLDKIGIKVGLPPADPPKTTTKTDKKNKDHEEKQRLLALELARERRRWEAADTDGDGRLSRREFRDFAAADASKASARMRQVVAAEALERLDEDDDGLVSEAEFLVGSPAVADSAEAAATAEEETRNFRDVWDADKSGYLDQGEMERMLDQLDSQDDSLAISGDDHAQHAKDAKELLEAADTDKDGGLSKAEVLAALRTFAESPATNYGDSVGMHDEL